MPFFMLLRGLSGSQRGYTHNTRIAHYPYQHQPLLLRNRSLSLSRAAMEASDVSKSLSEVRETIKQAKERCNASHEVELVAVSKTKPAELISQCYNLGQRHFGENYVQELLEKALSLPQDIRWHFIGPLQTNKAKKIVELPNLHLIESVHSAKLAEALNKHCASRPERLKVMVQVNTSGEESKSGVEPSECVELVQKIVNDLTKLEFVGLMTIGSPDGPPESDFQKLLDCRKEVCSKLSLSVDSVGLSMGMSGDFAKAVEMGSTNVRVGSLIFGAREYHK